MVVHKFKRLLYSFWDSYVHTLRHGLLENQSLLFILLFEPFRLLEELGDSSIDIISMVFVLSAIHPEKHQTVFDNLARVLKPGK